MSYRRIPAAKYRGPTLPGIDLSYWQTKVDFHEVAKSQVFVYLRAYDGKDQDYTFEKRWVEAREAGMRRGAYIYFRADRDGETQGERFAAKLESLNIDTGDLLPVVDLERKSAKNLLGGIWSGPGPNLPSRLVLTETLECLETLEKRFGVAPMMYTGEYFHWIGSQENPDLAAEFARFKLWVPSYNTERPRMPQRGGKLFPWKEWTIHQTSGRGRVEGVRGPVDLNVFRGDDISEISIGGKKNVCG